MGGLLRNKLTGWHAMAALPSTAQKGSEARTFFLPLLLLAAAKALASFDFCSLGACTTGGVKLVSARLHGAQQRNRLACGAPF